MTDGNRYIGYLATHERYFLGLDTLPLLVGISTYMFFWPGRYLTPESKIVAAEAPVGNEGAGHVEMGQAPPASAGGVQLTNKDVRVP
jgi:hypothetical protein